MMGKTYLDNISVGLEDARLLLGTGLMEVYFAKQSRASDDNEETTNSAYRELCGELEAVDFSFLDADDFNNDPASIAWVTEKKSYTREEMGFFETPEEDVRYGLDTFRDLYNDLRDLAGAHPKSQDFAISSTGHQFQPLLQMTKDIVRYGESFVALAEKINPDNPRQRRELRNYYNQVTGTLGKLQDYLFEADKFKV